jgi:hypothetical protein
MVSSGRIRLSGNGIGMHARNLVSRTIAICLYLKRILFWNSVLPKYLSGDFFSQNSDFVYRPHRFRFVDRRLSKISKAKVIFCPSHFLEDLLIEYGSEIRASILILGNSDRNFTSVGFNLPTSIKRVYAQNLEVQDSLWRVMPIGLENRRLGRNIFVNFRILPTIKRRQKVLCGPFSNTHSERVEIAKLDYSRFSSEKIEEYISAPKYRELLSKYQFVLCPRGNGVDTHRFWEVIYSGGVPIVKKSSWTQLIKDEGIFFLEVLSWTEDEIQRALDEFIPEASQLGENSFLCKDFWKARLRSN